MRIALASTLIVVCVGCAGAPDSIPFDIDRLTDAQRRVIRGLNRTDTTPYLERTRPVFFQIVQAGNDSDQVRRGGPIEAPVDVLVHALGEVDAGRLVDHGWIEDAATGKRVWSMRVEDTQHAGGDPRNRVVLARLRLAPGRYRLRYVSNAAHAFGDWHGTPPRRSNYYGIAVFNLNALPRIDAALREAGVPELAASLR